MEYVLEEYFLNLIDAEDNSCKIQLLPKINYGKAFLKERRKLYIIHYNDEILYIGESNSSIKTRFQRGCTSFNYYSKNDKARRGYKGYKWLNKKNNLNRNILTTVAVFDEKYDDNRSFIEAVEGELVYLVRNKLSYWPKFQNEIHFSNCEGAKELAEEILNSLLKDY